MSQKEVEEEATLMTSLAHPALPHVFGVRIERKPFLTVMQFHGLLKEITTHIPCTLRRLLHLEGSKEIITSDDLTHMLYVVCDALEYLHGRRILHNDLKADNIVIERQHDGQLSPVIVDFGKACTLENATYLHVDKCKQEQFMRRYKQIAPEVVKGKMKQSESSAIFSFGMVMSEVVRYEQYCFLQNLATMCTAR